MLHIIKNLKLEMKTYDDRRGEPNMRLNIIFGRDLLFSLVIPIIAIVSSIIMGQAFAQEASQNYIIRRVEIWSLF